MRHPDPRRDRRSVRRPASSGSFLVVIAFALLGGAVGTAIGLVIAAPTDASHPDGVGNLLSLFWSTITGDAEAAGPLAVLGAWGLIAGGFVLGEYFGLGVTSLRSHGNACPRCGTRNEPNTAACVACRFVLR
jgi:hypothetical protein